MYVSLLDHCKKAGMFQIPQTRCSGKASFMVTRVARFFLVHDTKTRKMYQIKTKCNKWSQNIPNGHKIYQHFPNHGPPKLTQISIFGLKINHLATLLVTK
jgi:hypothetical protein